MKERCKRKKAVTEKELKIALIKKALGYDCTEVVEEYVGGEEGEIKLCKKKVTTKNVPPDMTALKILLDEKQTDLSELTDEELLLEKKRLLGLLKELKD